MKDNFSVITMFTLSGVSGTTKYRLTIFVLALLCYCVIWLINVTIIVTTIIDKRLHQPMYIFLCNLCINGLYGTTGFYPKFLKDLLSFTNVISHSGCLLQGFVLHSSAGADFSILALMAYDRYVAICRPLAYHSVMTKQRVWVFVLIAWMVPLQLLLLSTVTSSTSRVCGSHIPKIYCVNYLVNKLACSASIAMIIIPAFNYTFYFCHVLFVIWSYAYLIRTCVKSQENRGKFMQTCLPHLLCLIVVVSSLLFDLLYMRYGSKTLPQSVKNFMAIEFLIVPPILNPLIYGLKLTQIRNGIISLLCSKRPST
ncbi:olfactory receptor 2K2-like [Halichoeres trimaculatus]|uniref:olfactory receptor 2K2-like n=1 Tax=Halichoeres trimaculatus TaxID=147232 RepID=UPI003D9E3DBB